MIIARRFEFETDAERAAFERRFGLAVPARQIVLVTGAPTPIVYATNAVPADVTALLEPRTVSPLILNGQSFEFGARPWVMGIVNVTPDSFSDGGRFSTTEKAVEHALQLIDEGADWLDVGGESTRPGAPEVPAELERDRVVPVIEQLRVRAPQIPISIDTSKPTVADAALTAGASLVNDVTALASEGMAAVVVKHRAAACLMHMQGTPRTMQQSPKYDDVVHEVAEALSSAIDRAVHAGVPRARLLIDPGIGFGKSLAHNLSLLKHLTAFRALGAPLLLGTSRKSFLGKLTNQPAAERRVVSSAVTVALAQRHAQIVRVHDVAATREALAVAAAIRDAE